MKDSVTATQEKGTERLLAVPEVADWLGVHTQTLYYWRHTHRGPPSLTVGGAVRYRASDIEQWLERGAKRGATP